MKTALQSDNAELLKTFDVLNLPVFVIDAAGRVVTCNDSVPRVFGWQRDEMVGLDVGKFLFFEGLLSDPAAMPVVSAPTPCYRKDGSSFHSRIVVISGQDLRIGLRTVVVRDAPEDGLPACMPPGKVAQVELINELIGHHQLQPQHRHHLPHGRLRTAQNHCLQQGEPPPLQ